MKRFITLFLLLILSMITFSCSDNKDDLQNDSVIIDDAIYLETKTNNYTIKDVQLNGNFLTIKISSSGCSGDSWAAKLIGSSTITKSNPGQRSIKLSLDNQELCLAVFQKEFTFDIRVLKEGHSNIILNLEGWKNQINYN